MIGSWERRWHPLLNEWVIISAASGARPWSGATATSSTSTQPQHDPNCFLCPGVTRASGDQNPNYTGPFAFDNDFATFAPHAPDTSQTEAPFAVTAPAKGACRVLCWTERHDMTLADLPVSAMEAITTLWRDEFTLLRDNPDVHQALMFENKGVEIGVSNLHPHGQAYGLPFVSSHAERMREAQSRYFKENGSSLLIDMLEHPSVKNALVVERANHWSVIVPFAARFAYETWIVPHQAASNLATLSDDALLELGKVYHRQAKRYDALFQRKSPNITHFHNAPCDGNEDNAHWCFHMVFQPPLREPDKLKYLGGFESSAGNITNPVQPEVAAGRLRELSI